MTTARSIDLRSLARTQLRLAAAPQAPWLHREVAGRMAERLGLMKAQPTTVLDWWARSGGSQEALRRAYPDAAVHAVETASVADRLAAMPVPWWRRLTHSGPSMLSDALVPAAGAQLVWANMVLHHVADPGALMAQWRRALAEEGFVMLSCLGPGTLGAIRDIYSQAGWGPPHAPFIDMHDIGDMLVAAGFSGPVMDQEQVTLTWATPDAALAELRSLGANADVARHGGLRTPRWVQRLNAALCERAAGPDGRIALGFEVIYGHAFNPAPRARAAGQTEVSLDEMRAMVRSHQGHRGA
jgi:malonyl-CoA O-methyltransferase